MYVAAVVLTENTDQYTDFVEVAHLAAEKMPGVVVKCSNGDIS